MVKTNGTQLAKVLLRDRDFLMPFEKEDEFDVWSGKNEGIAAFNRVKN